MPDYAVTQELSGAYYIIERATQHRVFGTFRESDARKRCDRMNGTVGHGEDTTQVAPAPVLEPAFRA